MEACGILALHAAGKYMDNERLLEFLNGCDSKAASYTGLCKVGAAQQDAASKAIQLGYLATYTNVQTVLGHHTPVPHTWPHG